MPDLEWPQVIVYLMGSCSWTSQQINSYKDSRAFALKDGNHIEKVQVHQINDHELFYVRAECQRQTSLSEKPYIVWVLLHSSGQVQSAGCQCTGDDGGCKHVVAVLFALIDFVDRHKDRGTVVGTDITCKWDKPRRQTLPTRIDDIDFRRQTEVQPKRGRFAKLENLDDNLMERDMVKLLKKHCSNAVALNILSGGSDSDGSETDSDMEQELPDLQHLRWQYEDLKDKPIVTEFLASSFTSENCETIKKLTQDQDESGEWMRQRRGRITASVAHSILHASPSTLSNSENYIVNNIMNRNLFTSAATSHGIKSEPIARQLYANSQKKHQSFSIINSGLIIDCKNPFLGASPDGIVSCKCCGTGVLEIKAPFSFRDKSFTFMCEQQGYHLYIDNGKVCCKVTSPWYTQVQMQMCLSKSEWCDLVVYTETAPFIEIIRIDFDTEWWSKQLPVLKSFFLTFIWPKLLCADL